MGFDKNKFIGQSFHPREGVVLVPDMKAFFPDDCESCEWKCSGLTADELSQCNEAADKMKGLATMVDAIAGGTDKEKMNAIKSVLGIDVEMTPDMVKRLELIVRGTVDVVVDLAMAVKLSQVYPIEFFDITNEILNLTGQGQEMGK